MRHGIACTVSVLTAAIASSARADLITVLAPETLIVNHNDIFIAGFTPTLTTAPTTPGSILHNSMRFSFRDFLGSTSALVSGNALELLPSEPFQTPALCVDGGLDQQGSFIDFSRTWRLPNFDLDNGVVSPASINTPILNITTTPDGGSGYIGYATSDLTRFGYMQIQRLSLYEWRLVGYRYDDSGAPVFVENLIPAPGALAILGAATLAPRRRRSTRSRRLRGATSSRHAS